MERFHTGLALMYLASMEKDPENFREAFRSHILQSTAVDFNYVLSRLEAVALDLHYEKAILYGKVCWVGI